MSGETSNLTSTTNNSLSRCARMFLHLGRYPRYIAGVQHSRGEVWIGRRGGGGVYLESSMCPNKVGLENSLSYSASFKPVNRRDDKKKEGGILPRPLLRILKSSLLMFGEVRLPPRPSFAHWHASITREDDQRAATHERCQKAHGKQDGPSARGTCKGAKLGGLKTQHAGARCLCKSLQ